MRRTPTAALAAATLVTATVLACGACTSSSPVPVVTTKATTTPSTAAPASPTPTTTPTPASTAVTADTVIDRTDKDLGIVFTDLPDVTGPAIDALNTYTLFETDFWKAVTTGKIPPDLSDITEPVIYDQVKAQVDGNKKGGTTLDGTNAIQIVEVKDVTSTDATVVTCQDAAGWVFTHKDGSQASGPEAGYDKIFITVTMSRPPTGLWAASTYTEGKAC